MTKELREEQVEVEETSLPYALHIHGYDCLLYTSLIQEVLDELKE